MLKLHPNCEQCAKSLPPSSTEAMICTFECTFCVVCVDGFCNVCPNCGGGFVPRPVRPKEELTKYPASTESNVKPVKVEQHKRYLKQYQGISPEQR